MKRSILKCMVAAGTLLSGALFSSSASAQTSFAATYSGAGVFGGSCSSTYNISGVEPTAAGTYPVFVYMVGTAENYNNAAAMAAVGKMAAKGYVAATIEYASSQFGSCSVLSAKSACAFNPNSAASAVSQLCSRAKADCSKGIVVAGFSQGSILAILAKNHDARVQAAYGTGSFVQYSTYDLRSCVANGNRALHSDRLRVVDGEVDNFGGSNASSVRGQLEELTGMTCGSKAYSCFNPNNSGWIIVKNREVSDGSADHCYMRSSGGCLGSENRLDPKWETGTANWALDANLNWLTNFTTK